MDQEKVGKLIAKIRKENNYTQAKFAEKLGVTFQAVSKWENGKSLPDIAILKRISSEFNVDLKDLLDGTPTTTKKKKRFLKIILLALVLVVSLIVIVVYISKKNDFEFRTISSKCSTFIITGSAAYNEDKTSLYISSIKYQNSKDTTIYKSLECSLYESKNNKNILISKFGDINSSNQNNNMSLSDFINKVSFNINSTDRCKDLSNNIIFIEIKAEKQNNKIISYKIPLKLSNNC